MKKSNEGWKSSFLSEVLKWEEKELQSTPSPGETPSSPPSEVKLGLATGSQSPPEHTEVRRFPSDYSWSQTWLSLKVWKSLESSFLHEVDGLLGELVWLTLNTLRQLLGQAPAPRVLQRYLSPSCSLWRCCTNKAGGYVSRQIYLFYFSSEKLRQLG